MHATSRKILIDLERLRYPNTGLANVFRNLTKGLLDTPSSIDYYYMLNPQEFLNQEARDLSIDDTKKEVKSMFVKIED